MKNSSETVAFYHHDICLSRIEGLEKDPSFYAIALHLEQKDLVLTFIFARVMLLIYSGRKDRV